MLDHVLLYCCESWVITNVDEVRLHRVGSCTISMMLRVKLVDRVLTDVLQDKVSAVVKIQRKII